MSNPLAIAAVTATLRDVLSRIAQRPPGDPQHDPELVDTQVSTRPLDKARTTEQRNQLNLFLYQALPNAAFRNTPPPSAARPGETAPPALALNLYYLLTAYGRGSDDVLGHRLLGRAMSLLHDQTVLSPAELRASLLGNDLHQQVERVRISPHTPPLEEMSKLWSMSQTQYRLSVAYEVSVVLIDSTRSVRAPLPVLSRGALESGSGMQPDLRPPFPTLTDLVLPHRQPGARLGTGNVPGDTLTLTGFNLAGGVTQLLFSHRLLASPLSLTPLTGQSDTELRVQLPAAQEPWPVGMYTVSALVRRAGKPDFTTNDLPLPLVPRLLQLTPPAPKALERKLTVKCGPRIWPQQRASLLLGDVELLSDPHPTQTDTLTFPLGTTPPGTYWVRLRVDGVDSLLVNHAATPLAFDESQKVTLS
ncbi:MAG TPA: DUF4255 domain-containing protein [Archangium sp.]|nr:DUF4255 domain-containing protein [Archangium sp.]